MFELPKLPYAYNALVPVIDEQTMRIHYEKHHGGYVEKLNVAMSGLSQYEGVPIETILGKLDTVPQAVRTAVRNHGGGHANHSLFWTVMGPHAGGKPSGKLEQAITQTFGSFEAFKEAFSAAALGRFGSGWAFLVVDEKRLGIVDTPNQDSPILEGKTPILGLDVWEHAYYLTYQNRRAEYIENWWSVVNWREVERRFAEAASQ